MNSQSSQRDVCLSLIRMQAASLLHELVLVRHSHDCELRELLDLANLVGVAD